MKLLFQTSSNYNRKALVFSAAKRCFALLVLLIFAGCLVIGNKDIPICHKLWKTLGNDLAGWRERCLDGDREISSSCCQTEKAYFEARRFAHRQMCFYEGPYPEPYLLVRTKTKISVVDLTSVYSISIIDGLNTDIKHLDIDPLRKEMYFEDCEIIFQSNFDGSNRRPVSKKAKNIWAFALDWIGKRLFWVRSHKKKVINVSRKDFKFRNIILINNETISSLAVDPDATYLFYSSQYTLSRINFDGKDKKEFKMDIDYFWITIDYLKKQVFLYRKGYWKTDIIISMDYDGRDYKTVLETEAKIQALAVFGDVMYWQKSNASVINVMNATSTVCTEMYRTISLAKQWSRLTNLVVIDKLEDTFREKPVLVDVAPSSYLLSLGENATLKCNFYNWQPDWKMIWYVNGKIIQKNKRFRQRNGESSLLRIRNVQNVDAGVYKCVASDKYGEFSVSKQLNVVTGNKPQLMDTATAKYIYKVGKTARLKCDFFSWKPEWKMTWYVQDKLVRIKKKKRFRQRNGKSAMLRIKSLDQADAGMYKCVASNVYGSVSRQLNLAVVGNKPQLMDTATAKYIYKVGKTARLKCDFFSWKPQWKMTWYVQDKLVQIKKKKKYRQRNGRSAMLRIKSLDQADARMYKCVASNVYGSVSRQLNLAVVGKLNPRGQPGKGRPWFLKAKPEQQYIAWPASADLTLRCRAHDGEPLLKYQWLKDGKVIKYRRLDPKFDGTRRYLRMKTAAPSDDGTYKCIVSNRLGNISHNIILTVIKKSVRPVLSAQYPLNKTARIDDNVTFQCVDLISLILTDYRWLHWKKLPPGYPDLGFDDNSPSVNSSYYTMINPRCYEAFVVDKKEGKYGGRVLLNNVTKEDEGMYTCLISNYRGKSWRSAFLRVISLDKEPIVGTNSILQRRENHNQSDKIGRNSVIAIITLGVVIYPLWAKANF